MSDVDELFAFVRRCVDVDEQVALAAIADDCGQDGGFEDADWLTDRALPTTTFGDAAAAMIRRFAVPRFVLAEVQAKRERLAWIESELADDETNETAQWLAQLEARPYAGQDGWREEWCA